MFINLALFSGLRKGELLALEWSDIDFENDTITVSKSVGYSKGAQFIKTPKTKNSFRKVTIPHFLTQRIKAMKAERYASFDSGLGKKFEDGQMTLEEAYEYGKKVGEPKQTSGKQELYEAIVSLYCE